MTINELPVIVEEKFSTNVDKVWTAIVNKEEITNWYFKGISAFESIIGFKTSFCVQYKEKV